MTTPIVAKSIGEKIIQGHWRHLRFCRSADRWTSSYLWFLTRKIATESSK